MNNFTFTSLQSLAIALISIGLPILLKGDFVGGGILVVLGALAQFAYEKFPVKV